MKLFIAGQRSFFILIALLAGILVSIWFREGNILGTAEAIIPFHNLERYKDKTAWAWTDFQLGST